MSSLIRRRAFAVLATISLVAPVPAFAGPNDNLIVRTKVHVDSPNAFWDKEADNFTLKSKSGDVLPIEKTVNWVSKGAVDLGEYVYRVPEYNRMSFLGEPGKRLYWSGKVEGGKGAPIWAGFGADIGLPTEKFRDKSFNLEIDSFDGPGKMELFRGTGAPGWPVERLWSSHETGLRATWIDKGNHTHNFTTYSKPGQYEITYRASARTVDGKLIQSEPQKLVWQVGGSEPNKSGLGDVKEAYEHAESYGSKTGGKFSIQPYVGEKYSKAKGDMTQLSFDTGNSKDSGHAVFFIDGYYLAEVPVKNGKAEWIEMIGDDDSDFQVVYVPSKESETKRWISRKITAHTDPNGELKETAESTEDFPVGKAKEPAPEFNSDEIVPDSNVVSVSTSKLPSSAEENDEEAEGDINMTVAPNDDRLVLQVKGGYYSAVPGVDLNDLVANNAADCPTDFISYPGHRTMRQNVDGCEEGYILALDIIPTSRTMVGGKATLVDYLGDKFRETKPTDVQFAKTESIAPSKNEGDETEKPDGGVSNSHDIDEESENVESEGNDTDGPIIDITHGHVDIAPRDNNDELALMLKDESGIASDEATWRDPQKVRFIVKEDRLISLKDDSSILGKKGTKVYILPESGSQSNFHPWPGLSTEELYAKTGKNYSFNFNTKSKPENGKWVAFTGGTYGNPLNVIADSSKPSTFKAEGSMHKHMSWGFSEPGVYEIEVTVTEDGGKKTKPAILTFVVGDTAKPTGNKIANGNHDDKELIEPLVVKPNKPVRNSEKASDNEQGSLRPIETGHLDFGPAFVNDKLGFYIGDESGRATDSTDASGHHLHDPNKVVLVVGANRKRTLGKEVPVNEDTEFIGKKGDTFYHLPLSEDHSAIWPGFDTNKIAHAFPKGMDIEIKPESQPEGARWYAHRFSNLGTSAQRIADSTGPARIHSDKPFHSHLDWIFTAAGTYKIQMRAVNDTDATDWTTITFDVDSNNAAKESVDKPLKAATPLSGAPVSKASESAAKKKADKSKSGLLANTGLSAAEWLMALAMLLIGAGFWILGMKRMRD